MTHQQPEPADEALIDLLCGRDGQITEVLLRDGRRLTVLNIAWGYDLGDEFAHVTTNISPSVDDLSIDFFFTEDVTAVLDPRTGEPLFQAE